MHQTCVIIPCYNESGRFPVTSFENFLSKNPVRLHFINDGSTDQTQVVLQELQNKFPEKVKITTLAHNKGKAEAVRQGFLATLQEEDFRYIGYFDADLATPLEELVFIQGFLAGEIKVAIGSRVQRLGTSITRNPLRHYLGRIFATYANAFLGIRVYDSQCGAKIFQSDVAAMLFQHPFQSKWLFDLEILYRLKHAHPDNFNSIIIEVPLRSWMEKGDSKLRVSDFLLAPFELIRIKKHTLEQ